MMNSDFLEINCADCGEPMLVSPGEKINFRSTDEFNFLCAVCNKKEDPNQKRTVTCLGTLESEINTCFLCNNKTNDFHNIIDKQGNFLKICSDCANEDDFEL